jgi:hypothetical protein
VTNLHRHRRARTRDALHRRVRALTAVVGLTSLTGAGALTIELAQPSAAAVQPKTPVTTPASPPAQPAAPAATPHVTRVRHHKAARQPAPAPAPAQSTASTSTSGGS